MKIYSTPEVKIMFDLEEIKQELPKVNLDTSSETQGQSVRSGEKENFRRAFSPGPTDRPWVSEDDLDTTEEKFEKWSSLFQEIKKMITKKRMRHKYIRQLKNKERLENIKKRVKLTRNQERLVQAESATIIGEITDLQE